VITTYIFYSKLLIISRALSNWGSLFELTSSSVSSTFTSGFKPISEIDTKELKKVSPSYYLLPSNFPVPICSGRDALCKAVMNDNYTSMPHGSENYKFKSKNPNEDILFRIEDEIQLTDI